MASPTTKQQEFDKMEDGEETYQVVDEDTTNEEPEGETIAPEEEEEEKPAVTEPPSTPQPHPYEYLINTFQYQPEQLTATKYEKLQHLSETNLQFITSKVAFLKMLQDLRAAKQIAIEAYVTAHDYIGAVSVLCLSTASTDYCLDCTKLKNEILILTDILINPMIVKIVYDADTVLSIFQLRFHLYMINVFDVKRANELVIEDHGQKTVAEVIKDNFEVQPPEVADIDWRRRPLTDTQKDYARFASHYLIYLYHDYKSLLLDKGEDVYRTFLDDCRHLSKTIFTEQTLSVYEQFEEQFKRRQLCELEVLKKLWEWRDGIAKKTNSNPGQVLSKPALMRIASHLLSDPDEILQISHSNTVRQNITTIVEMVNEAKKNTGHTETVAKPLKTKRKNALLAQRQQGMPPPKRSLKWQAPPSNRPGPTVFQMSFVPPDPSDMRGGDRSRSADRRSFSSSRSSYSERRDNSFDRYSNSSLYNRR